MTADSGSTKPERTASVDLVGLADPILDAMSEGVVLHDARGRILGCNPAARRMLALTEAELLGRGLGDCRLLDESGAPLVPEAHPVLHTARTGAPVRGQVIGVECPKGPRRWLRVNTSVVEGSEVAPLARVMSTFVDITRERTATAALRQREAMLQALFEHASVGLVRADARGRVRQANAAWQRLSGGAHERWLDAVVKTQRARVTRAWHRLVRQHAAFDLEAELDCPDRGPVLVEIKANLVFVPDEPEPSYIVTVDDLSAEQQLLRERERFFEAAPDLRCMMSLEGRFLRVNRAFEIATGWSAANLAECRLVDLVHPDDLSKATAAMARLADGAPLRSLECRCRCRDGQWRWLSWACPAPEAGEDVLYAVAHDVTLARNESERLARQARTDPLTGALNRAGLEAEIGARVASRPAGFGLVFADLDDFKPINDRFGHRAGDEVLIGFVRRLQGLVRKTDFVVRLGGDEFLVVLPDADRSSTARVARGVEAMMREPFVIRGQAVSVSCSVGESCCPTQSGLQEAIAEADAAMYATKAARSRADDDAGLVVELDELSQRDACSSSTPAV